MSRIILNDHPWTEDEIAYQVARNRHSEIEKNKKDFPPGSEPELIEQKSEKLQLDTDIFEYVDKLGLDELKSDLSKAGLEKTGEVVDLKKRLAQYLQDERDADNND